MPYGATPIRGGGAVAIVRIVESRIGTPGPSRRSRGCLVQTIADLVNWVRQLEPSFAFLLGLPVLVAVAGLAAEAVRRRSIRSSARQVGRASTSSEAGRAAQVP